MATRAQIEFDFAKAKSKAKQLDEIADKLEEVSETKMNDTLQNISENWKGTNASGYLAKGYLLRDEIRSIAHELHSNADEIRKIAKRLYNAEMNALRIAVTRE